MRIAKLAAVHAASLFRIPMRGYEGGASTYTDAYTTVPNPHEGL